MNNEDKREKQIKFERNLITFPYLDLPSSYYYLIYFIQILKLQWRYLVYFCI